LKHFQYVLSNFVSMIDLFLSFLKFSLCKLLCDIGFNSTSVHRPKKLKLYFGKINLIPPLNANKINKHVRAIVLVSTAFIVSKFSEKKS
jgi:hypothetical protein